MLFRSHDLIQVVVDGANRERSRFEQVKRFVILPRDFTMEEGEVTPTLKLRRRTVAEHFAGEIEELYAEPRLDARDDLARRSPARSATGERMQAAPGWPIGPALALETLRTARPWP